MLRQDYQILLYDLSEIYFRLFCLLKEGMSMADAKAALCVIEGGEVEQLDLHWESVEAHWVKAKIFRVKAQTY